MLPDRLEHVQARIRQACLRSRRDPASVRLIAATKGIAADIIRQAVELGITDLGENRVQEALAKQAAVGRRPKAEGRVVRWHLIGHLQSNKVKLAVQLFDVIHSVDSLPLVAALERAMGERPQAQPALDVLIQVNTSGEPTKSGYRPDQAIELVDAVRHATHLRLAGLMTMAPLASDAEATRPCFRQLRELRDAVTLAFGLQPSALGLSMGMSQDFEVAIEEGADVLRIGTAIFGQRT